MPKLIKNITATYDPILSDDVNLFKSIEGIAQTGDYQLVFGYIAFLQDYSQVETIVDLPTPQTFGLVVNNNREFIELNISY